MKRIKCRVKVKERTIEDIWSSICNWRNFTVDDWYKLFTCIDYNERSLRIPHAMISCSYGFLMTITIYNEDSSKETVYGIFPFFDEYPMLAIKSKRTTVLEFPIFNIKNLELGEEDILIFNSDFSYIKKFCKKR